MTASMQLPPQVPDEVEPTIAWRSWGLEGVDQLTPISMEGVNPYNGGPIWRQRDAKRATCLANANLRYSMGSFMIKPGGDLTMTAAPPNHHAPDPKCLCGYWALKSPPERPYLVVGTVKLWGKIVCGSDGYRAEYAYPDRLYLLDRGEWASEPQWHREGRARLLADAYGVECSLISHDEYELLRRAELPDLGNEPDEPPAVGSQMLATTSYSQPLMPTSFQFDTKLSDKLRRPHRLELYALYGAILLNLGGALYNLGRIFV